MHSRPLRLGLVLVAAAGLAAVAVGGLGWRDGAASVGSDGPVASAAAPVVPPALAELRPGPSRAATLGRGPRPRIGPRSEDGTVVRRVHVRLADGTDAKEGEVLFGDVAVSNDDVPRCFQVLASASIGARGIAELRLDAGDEKEAGTLFVAVPGQPNEHQFTFGLAQGPTEVTLPESVPFAGSVVDAEGRGVPYLPIVVTSGLKGWFVADEDLEFARRATADRGVHFPYIAGQTDGAGRFEVRVPRPAPGAPGQLRVLSRDVRWFASDAALPPVDPEHGVADAVVRVERGIAFDVRATERDGSALPSGATLKLHHPTDRYPMWIYEGAIEPAANRVRMKRLVSPDAGFEFALTLALPGHATGLARVTIPAGLDEGRAEFVLDRSDDEARTGLVELTLPNGPGEALEATEYELRVSTEEAPSAVGIELDVRSVALVAGTNRIIVRLPEGAYRLWLDPWGLSQSAGYGGRHHRFEFKADVTVVPRATTRVAMDTASDQ